MDIHFKCLHCATDLEVEAEAAGEQIECPNCSQTITIPQGFEPVAPRSAAPPPPPPAEPKVEKRMSVPLSTKPAEPLIQKASKPLEVVAKESRPGLKVRTLRHADCKEVGKDLFDARLSDVLNEIGDANIISITPINYSYVDMGTQKLLNDFGVMIVYRG